MVVIIIVLITMLMMDFLAAGTGSPARNLRAPAGIVTTGSASSSIPAPPTTWTLDLSGPPAEPGLSQPRAR
jgi:hypothetical protein